MDDLTRIASEIETHKRDLIQFCQDLVRSKSLSGNEGDVAEIIAQKMKSLGISQVSTDELGSVLGTIKGETGSILLFNGHMDHVPAGNRDNWNADPYSAEIKDIDGQQVIIGRGTVDMKGALAAQIFAVGMICQLGITPPGDVHIAAVVHEEGHEGSAMEHIVNQRGINPDIVILGEPTALNLSIGQRGRCELEVVTRGQTSHGSKPELGNNAVYNMTKIIKAVEQLNSQHMPEHSFLGQASIALIRISSSPDQGNVVPDECRIVLDRRTTPGETENDLINEINQIIRTIKAKEPELDAHVSVIDEDIRCYTGSSIDGHKFYPAWSMDPSHPLIQRSKSILTETMNSPVNIGKWDFSTDGVFTAGKADILTFGYGPGNEVQAHRPNEHLPIEQLVAAAKGYAALALKLVSLD